MNGRPVAFAMILVLSLTVSTNARSETPSPVTAGGSSTASHPLDPALRLAAESLQNIRANVHDYEALFVKRCRVDGELPELQYANIKIRNRKKNNQAIGVPMAVYLDFIKPDDLAGREIIWVEGQNDNKLIAHESGVKGLINVHLDPAGYLAMRGQRYPITEIGIENLLVKMLEIGRRDRQHADCDVQFFPDAKLADRQCLMVQVVHARPAEHFEFQRARIYFDKKLNVPIRYVSWSWPETPGGQPVLEEEYTYLDLRVNAGLTDRDFHITNPDYRFR